MIWQYPCCYSNQLFPGDIVNNIISHKLQRRNNIDVFTTDKIHPKDWNSRIKSWRHSIRKIVLQFLKHENLNIFRTEQKWRRKKHKQTIPLLYSNLFLHSNERCRITICFCYNELYAIRIRAWMIALWIWQNGLLLLLLTREYPKNLIRYRQFYGKSEQ